MDEQPIIHLGAPKENKPKIKPMIIPEDSFDEVDAAREEQIVQDVDKVFTTRKNNDKYTVSKSFKK